MTRPTAADALDPALDPGPDPVRDALLDSRQRWRELVLLGADLAFETDGRGRFVLLAPETVLGWQADEWLGQPADRLLADPERGGGFNPFRPVTPTRDRRAWLKRADGTTACLSFATAPMRDPRGCLLGARGVAQDVTEADDGDEALAAAVRRGEVIDHILWRMNQEVMAPRMMAAALTALGSALGAEGVGVLEPAIDVPATLQHAVGATVEGIAEAAQAILAANADSAPAQGPGTGGRALVVCGCETRFGKRTALVIWRPPGIRVWTREDLSLVASAAAIARVVLEHESIQQEMARQARTDPLTGLLNRRAFLEEVTRRIDRLDREGVPGTLMFIDLDHFKQVNDVRGHDCGDEALCIIANLLRAAVRPADLVARFGGDEFAVWLDGMEELSASERAEMLRIEGPPTTAHLSTHSARHPPLRPLTLSIGIATRWPGRSENVDGLIQRADQVMYEVKRAGRGHWRVSRMDPW